MRTLVQGAADVALCTGALVLVVFGFLAAGLVGLWEDLGASRRR